MACPRVIEALEDCFTSVLDLRHHDATRDHAVALGQGVVLLEVHLAPLDPPRLQILGELGFDQRLRQPLDLVAGDAAEGRMQVVDDGFEF